MSISVNGELLGLMLVFVFAVQLAVEVMVFGWNRADRFNQLMVWADFVEQSKATQTTFKWLGVILSILWIVALTTYPLEAFISAAVAVALICVSVYFTLFDKDGNYIGVKL